MLVYTGGARRQPCGFKKEQVFTCYCFGSPEKNLYGIDDTEHPDVWEALADEAIKVAMEVIAAKRTQTAGASPLRWRSNPAPPPILSLDFSVASQRLRRRTGTSTKMPTKARRLQGSKWRSSSVRSSTLSRQYLG